MDDIESITEISEFEALEEIDSDFDGMVSRIDSYGGIDEGDVLPSGLKAEALFEHPESDCVWGIFSKGKKWYNVEFKYRTDYFDIPF